MSANQFVKKIANADGFLARHVGVTKKDEAEMLQTINCPTLEKLLEETIPDSIRLPEALDLPEAVSEFAYMNHVRKIAAQNAVFRSYIGLGYHDCIVPPVIQRNILENPGWYTAYTPYQSEIAQGRLEGLLNFQTVVSDLTGMEIANASLLDEATAAAEAMTMLYRQRDRSLVKADANIFLVADDCFPQTIDVLNTRAEPLGIEVRVLPAAEENLVDGAFGVLLQYPGVDGQVRDYRGFIESAHQKNILIAVAADLLSLTLLMSPGEMGADVVVGSSQRLGVPMGYGGPHAAFFATREAYKRQVPGRIIGVSVDRNGKPAYRMALQTREQHIRREKATSNICTAQTLLAIMSGMYAVYHGPEGLKAIAERIHYLTAILATELSKMDIMVSHRSYFDTLSLHLPGQSAKVKAAAESAGINFNFPDGDDLTMSLNETATIDDINDILDVFATAMGKSKQKISLETYSEDKLWQIPQTLRRKSPFLEHAVFHRYRSETDMMRYIKRLENKDLSLVHSMIPLGSCTMKLNAASELIPISWAEFGRMHPFAPREQAGGYRQMFDELERMLAEITGFHAISLQPNSGAQGEYAGMMVIRAYHRDRGEGHRHICLIPESAHGTNPASANMAGLKVVVVKCDADGDIDIEDLKNKAREHKDNLAALMVTYPSTHGVFEAGIREVCQIIHDNGGQVYMDGANMNAQVGLTNPAIIGADVCHLNLHKTFSIPHGGGGPGMGPIGVVKHLAPYLPGHRLVSTGGDKAISAISTAPWGSAGILLISYGYIKMLGRHGVTHSTACAILNANYIKARLKHYFPVLYSGKKDRIAHELIFDLRPIKHELGIEVEDIAKRLMDYGFHAPTVSFPVIGTIMVEPTESESKAELDRFCEAMINIHREIEEIRSGAASREHNVLKNAPHTVDEAISGEWNHPYSREKAVYPLPFVKANKFWPSVARIDNAYGDRHLICSCPPMSAYDQES